MTGRDRSTGRALGVPEEILVKIHDTVFKDCDDPQQVKQHVAPSVSYRYKPSGSDMMVDFPADIGTISVKEIDEIPNTIKRNSAKDDTLTRKFSPVSL